MKSPVIWDLAKHTGHAVSLVGFRRLAFSLSPGDALNLGVVTKAYHSLRNSGLVGLENVQECAAQNRFSWRNQVEATALRFRPEMASFDIDMSKQLKDREGLPTITLSPAAKEESQEEPQERTKGRR